VLVTCLCLTRNRRHWLPKAIQCFLDQTYTDRELLIVADGEPVLDLIPEDSRIWLIETDALRVGDKRNFGCQHANGEIIAHWDDDDYSAPRRLEDQVARLTKSGRAVTAYRTMRFTDGQRSWIYQGMPMTALGTSLCYRKDFWERYRFTSMQIGEDFMFAAQAQAQGQLTVEDAGDLMYATVHSGNTSPRRVDNNGMYKPVTA